MFVHPSQVDQVTKRHGEIARSRLVIEHDEQSNDRMTLQCEVSAGSDALETAIAETIRDVTKLRGEVAFVEGGSLPNDGKVIDDLRKFD
jgi:phenylacetate-CoA ligase